MKAKKLLWIALLSVFAVSGCAGRQRKMEFIGNEEAKRLALADAGFEAQEVQFTAAGLENRSGVDYYQVAFTASGKNYKYDINAITGKIIETNAAQSHQADTSQKNQPVNTAGNSAVRNGQKEEQKKSETSAADKSSEKVITSEEAKEKAVEHAGVSSKEAAFIKSELDYENGRQIYEVEFYTEDGREYDYEIDAVTGEVISFDYDAEGIPSSGGKTKVLSEQEAQNQALAQVPGASVDDIYEFEVDSDDGRMEYEGKIIYNGMEYEFKIDAYSGAIRSWEAEPADS